jgi:hypothetical protein
VCTATYFRSYRAYTFVLGEIRTNGLDDCLRQSQAGSRAHCAMDWWTYTDVAAWTLVLIIAVCNCLNRGQVGSRAPKPTMLLISLLTFSSPSDLFHSPLSSMIAYRVMLWRAPGLCSSTYLLAAGGLLTLAILDSFRERTRDWRGTNHGKKGINMVRVVEQFGCCHVNRRAPFIVLSVKMTDVEVLFCCVDVR